MYKLQPKLWFRNVLIYMNLFLIFIFENKIM